VPSIRCSRMSWGSLDACTCRVVVVQHAARQPRPRPRRHQPSPTYRTLPDSPRWRRTGRTRRAAGHGWNRPPHQRAGSQHDSQHDAAPGPPIRLGPPAGTRTSISNADGARSDQSRWASGSRSTHQRRPSEPRWPPACWRQTGCRLHGPHPSDDATAASASGNSHPRESRLAAPSEQRTTSQLEVEPRLMTRRSIGPVRQRTADHDRRPRDSPPTGQPGTTRTRAGRRRCAPATTRVAADAEPHQEHAK